MSDLSEKQWQEYLAKDKRDILWRALSNLRSAQASLQIVDQPMLYNEVTHLGNKVEYLLKDLYKDASL